MRSPSDNEFDEEDDEEGTGISRTRLRIDQARSRFMPASVDARDVDFSDRLTSKRKSYKASSRRQRILEDGTEEFGELSDEEETLTLERRLARLKREIEEVKEEHRRQKEAEQRSTPDHDEEISSLSEALNEISRSSEIPRSRPPTSLPSPPQPPATAELVDSSSSATYTLTYTPSYSAVHALSKAADFDRRLHLLERSLGIGSSALPELDSSTGLPRAVLPTLEHLQRQLTTLSTASTSSLDSISRRVRTLTSEAESLEKARRNAKAAQEALASTGAAVPDAAGEREEDAEQTAKINALYGTLPTIESLAPLLPPLLDRLRSLRAIHADAAGASEMLERLERRQGEMAAEIGMWREGLEKVEGAMREGEEKMDGNRKLVEGWVKELEAKMERFS